MMVLNMFHVKVFPAQAGVIPNLRSGLSLKFCIPRASGGDPFFAKHFAAAIQYSPRKRG